MENTQTLAHNSAIQQVAYTPYELAVKLSNSELCPFQYKGKPETLLLAIEMGQRLGVHAFEAMQNINIIKGRPSLSSTFIISLIKKSGIFSEHHFENGQDGDVEVKLGNKKETVKNLTCRMVATYKGTGTTAISPTVSVKMADAEGWYYKPDKNGANSSKWPNLTELMLMYRSAAFFGRLYCAHLLMGMQTSEEIQDTEYTTINTASKPSFNLSANSLSIPTIVQPVTFPISHKEENNFVSEKKPEPEPAPLATEAQMDKIMALCEFQPDYETGELWKKMEEKHAKKELSYQRADNGIAYLEKRKQAIIDAEMAEKADDEIPF